jgi:hypothetical protein
MQKSRLLGLKGPVRGRRWGGRATYCCIHGALADLNVLSCDSGIGALLYVASSYSVSYSGSMPWAGRGHAFALTSYDGPP